MCRIADQKTTATTNKQLMLVKHKDRSMYCEVDSVIYFQFEFFVCFYQDVIDECISNSKTVSQKGNSIYQSNRKLSRSPPSKTPSSPPVSRRTTVLKSTLTKSCRCRRPHTTFPGFMHYFNNGDNNSDNDDDDVVAVSN